jgi:hypothetical protein
MQLLVCYSFYLGTSLHESVLCSQLIVILTVIKAAEKCVVYQLGVAFSSVLCISWVWHSLLHVKYSTCLSYVRVLCLCSISCSGKRWFWPRVSKFTPRSRCTRGLVVLIPVFRGAYHIFVARFQVCRDFDLGEFWVWTPVSCGCISNRGKESIRISSSSWFSDFCNLLFIRFSGVSCSFLRI